MPDSNLPPGFVLENDTNYTPLVNAAGDKYGVDPNLIRAHMDVESHGDPNAVSPQGAGGLMQIMPDTARSLGVQDRFRPYDSINGAAKLMRQNYDRYGTPYEAIAAYHGGTDTSQWGPRTHDYVGKVMDRWQHYKEQAGQAQPKDQPPPPGFVLEDQAASKPPPPGFVVEGSPPQKGLPQRPPGSKPFDLPTGEREQAPQSYKAAGLPPAARDEGPAPAPRPPADQTVSDVDEFGTPLSVSAADKAEALKDTPPGRIISAAVQGAKEGFGPDAPGMDATTEQTMQKAGVFPSDQNGGPLRQFNEAVVKPLWSVGDAAVRGVSGAFRAGQSAVAQTGLELAPYIDPALNAVGLGSAAQLGRDVAAYPESIMGDIGAIRAPRPSVRQHALETTDASARDTLSQVAKGSKTPVLDAMAEKAREANNLAAAEAQTPKAPVEEAPVPPADNIPTMTIHPEREEEAPAPLPVADTETAGKVAPSPAARPVDLEPGESTGDPYLDRMVAEHSQKLETARQYAEAGKPMRFTSPDNPRTVQLVSPEISDGHKPGEWRVTTFRDDQPTGHYVMNNAEEAFREVTVRDMQPVGAPKAPEPATPSAEVTPEPTKPGEATSEADYGAAPTEPTGKATPFEKEPKEPLRLSKFLAQPILRNIGEATEHKVPGGLQDEGGEVSNILGGKNRRPGFINKNGRTLEDAAQAAWEAGYFPEHDSPPSANDLLGALRDDFGGVPQYSHHDAEAVENYHGTRGQNAEIDRLAQQYGIEPKGLTRDQFFDQVHERASADERADHEASLGADWLSDERAAEQEAVDWVAYHASPHDFDAFDIGKIGTGEGAQAFGHGLYFAEGEGTRDNYLRQFEVHPAVQEARTQWSDRVNHLNERMDELGAKIDQARKAGDDDAVRSLQAEYKPIHDEWSKIQNKPPKPSSYTVRVRAKPDEMLDWDKPLSEQPQKVKDALEKLGVTQGDLPGSKILDTLHHNQYDNNGPIGNVRRAEDMLRAEGVKGVRYLDRQNRSAGEGTRNIVVFDHNDVDITHKNGVAVPKRELTRKELYGQSQARTLEDYEREHQQITAATGPLEHAAADARSGHAGTREGAGEEGIPQERGAVGDAGRGEAGAGEEAGKDLLGRDERAQPATRTPEPTIRNDPNQETMPGMEPSARQAQAARDAAGPRTDQKPADEGVFAKPEAEHAGLPLYGGLPMLDPNAWKFMASPILPHAVKALEATKAVATDIAEKFAPMRNGTVRAKAFAADFANNMRQAQYRFGEIDKELEKNFTAAEREKMARAMDAQSVFEQELRKMPEADRAAAREAFDKGGTGVEGLTKQQRHVVDALDQMSQHTWREMQKRGMVDPKAQGLPYYFPRQILRYTEEEGFTHVGGKGGTGADINKIGKNLSTNGPMRREHLTPEETEAAAKAKLGDDTAILKDIRSLPNRLLQTHRSIAGVDLMNKIEEVGKDTGVNLVVRGDIPDLLHPADYFTIAGHPAFRQFTGTGWRATHVATEFEGPLRAVLTAPAGKLYTAAMNLKGGIMRSIMYSPFIHLAVELGRALPVMAMNDPIGTLTFKTMRDGSYLRRQPAYMDQAIHDGLAPIGRGWSKDPTTLADEAKFEGQSGPIKKAFHALEGVHQKLLWDQVFNLQVGLYDGLRNSWIKKGYDPEVAGTMAAHIANRYAGALPTENLSRGANMAANLMMFSRSFTLGNLGVVKDMMNGAPSHTIARLEQMAGPEVAKSAQSALRRKAVAAFVLDIGLFYMSVALLQTGIQAMRTGVDATEQDLMDKAHVAWEGMKQGNLLDAFKFLPQSWNEPGKEDRVFAGTDSNGRGVYFRLPPGKVGEEFMGWFTKPATMVANKLNPPVRAIIESIFNTDSMGRQVYQPHPEGLAEHMKVAGAVVKHIAESMGPTSTIEGLHEMYKQHVNDEKTTSDPYVTAAKILGPFTGLAQISSGYPGGPEAGVMHNEAEKQRWEQNKAIPDIKKKIAAGDIQGAVDNMNEIGVPRGLQRYYIQQAINPGPTKNQVRRFNQTATPEDRDRIERVTH